MGLAYAAFILIAAQAPEEEEWDPDLSVEAQRETPEARTTDRVSVSLLFGYIADPAGAGPGVSAGPNLGPTFIFSKPLWMGTRRRYNQFLFEARASVGVVPRQFSLLIL